ncbi:hypothetical protein ACIQXQ_20240 [Peribacillus sp. NPDC097198]|uniref:hypothetical protein n=1 Tax=Peribacillus sp. NPDC097198 TaxID=3364397 RepID=UPI0037F9B7A5
MNDDNKKMNEVVRNLQSISKNYINQINTFNINMAPIYQSIHEMTYKMSQIGNLARKYINESGIQKSLAKIRKGVIETEEDLKLFKSLMVEMGYPPHEGINIGTMRSLAQSYREDKSLITSEVIDDFMFNYYDSEKIKSLAIEWENNKILKERLPILRNVVTAHNLGLYNLSIPAILAQLEGTLVDAFGIKGKVDGNIIKLILKSLLRKDILKNSGFNFDNEIHDYYEKNILVGFEHGKTIGSEISRNAILHGADKSYGELANSIKVILLFDYIANAIETLESDTKNHCKREVKKYRQNKKNNYRKK